MWWTSGNTRNCQEPVGFKALAVKPGLPDLFALRDGRFFALALRRENGRGEVSGLLNALSVAGAETAVAFSMDEALLTLERWGLLVKNARYSE